METFILRAALVLLVYFFVGYLVSWKIRNWSWVDVLWTFSFPLICLTLVLTDHSLLEFPPFLLLSGMYLVWSFRLGTHLSRRIYRHHPEMEGRYLKLQRQWKDAEARSFLFFFLSQAVMSLILALPIYFVATAQQVSAGWIGVGIFWSLCFVGESLADSQLNRFKADPNNKGKVCEQGLWAYSRHPNYFFEWMMWVAYAALAIMTHPYGWIASISPLFMLYLILKVTGVVPTEAQSLRSRGEAFRDYQRRVSVFVPWKPKKKS